MTDKPTRTLIEVLKDAAQVLNIPREAATPTLTQAERARELLEQSLREIGEERMADNFRDGRHPIIVTSQAALRALERALSPALPEEVGEVVERLRGLLAEQKWAADWPHNIVPPGKPAHELACEAIRALPTLLTALSTRRAEGIEAAAVERIARNLIDQSGEPWPSGTESDRLHYWRDKAINAAKRLRNLNQDAG